MCYLTISQCATLIEDFALSDEENVKPGEEAVLLDEKAELPDPDEVLGYLMRDSVLPDDLMRRAVLSVEQNVLPVAGCCAAW